METQKEIFSHVNSIISSGEDYSNNSYLVFQSLAHNSKEYTDSFLKVLTEVFTSPDFNPSAKFYALYLLCKASEPENKFLVTRLSRNRALLDKLFKDAQFEGSKPLEEKGRRFFSKTPTPEEATIGNNYLRLLLEALKYWGQTYATDDKKNPLHIYQVMYSTLAQKIKFPETFVYFTITYQVSNGFHLQSAASLAARKDLQIAQTSSSKPNEEITGEESQEIFTHVQLASSSHLDYEKYSPFLLNIVRENSRPRNTVILSGITQILKGDEYPSTTKFYALLLLVKITETKNDVFVSQLSQEKTLKDLFAQQGLVDKEKPMKERGKTMFKENANNEIIGTNYFALLIEAIHFWNQSFVNQKNKKEFFGYLYTLLNDSKKVQFPAKYFYIGRNLPFEEEDVNSSLNKKNQSPNHQEQHAFDLDLVIQHVQATITSGRDYKNNSWRVFEGIATNHMEYISSYLKITSELVTSKTLSPTAQFYTLFLLLKLTETKNDILLSELPNYHDLLNEFFEQAQLDRHKEAKDKGKTLFSKNPTAEEARLGNNYMTLALETLVYWKQITEKRDSKGIFNIIYQTLNKKTKLPQQFFYVENNIETDGSHLPTKFELIAPEDLISIQKNISQGPKDSQKIADGALESNDPIIKKAKEALTKLEQDKTSLRDVLENNMEENDLGEFLDFLFKDVSNTYHKSVEPSIDPLLTSRAPSAEKLVTQIFAEGEIAEQISAEFAKYKSGKLNYRQLRLNILTILKPQTTSSGLNGNLTPGEDKSSPKKHTAQVIVQKAENNVVPNEKLKKSQMQIHDIPLVESVMGTVETKKRNQLIVETPIIEADRKLEAGSVDQLEPSQQRFFAKSLQDDEDSATIYTRSQQALSETQPEKVSVDIEKSSAQSENIMKSSSQFKQQGRVAPDESNGELRNSTAATNQKKMDNLAVSKYRAVNVIEETQGEYSEVLHTENQDAISKLKSGNQLEDDSKISRETVTIKKQDVHQLAINKYRSGGELEDDHEEIKSSKMLQQQLSPQSNKLTPDKRKWDIEGEDFNRSMRLSRLKQNDLTMIESSIRNSFVSTGKRPPQFKPLTELQVREELEKEITKLKSERDYLQNENSRLNTEIKQNAGYQTEFNDEQLRELLGQHQLRIEALQEENTALMEENIRLKRSIDVESQYRSMSKGEKEVRDVIEENVRMKERIRELENQLTASRFNGTTEHEVRSHRRPEGAVHGRFGSDLQDDEDEENDKFETPVNDSGIVASNYDVDWANTSHNKHHVDRSEYDVEWPLTAYKEKQHEGQLSSRSQRETVHLQEIKGRLVNTDNQIFKELLTKLQGISLSNDIHTFKMACLQDKCPLFENDILRVGVSTSLVYDENNHKNILKLVLYFQNKGEQVIDQFITEFADLVNLNRIAKPGQLQTFIEPRRQAKQQVIIAFDSVPFECLQVFVTSQIQRNEPRTFNLFLPTLITKFMSFKPVTAEIFRAKWGIKTPNVIKSEGIDIDTSILRNVFDLKKYFNNLVELTPLEENENLQGRNILKFGGLFELDVPNAEYLLTINVFSSQKIVFQIAAFDSVSRNAIFLLQTLVFLFKRA